MFKVINTKILIFFVLSSSISARAAFIKKPTTKGENNIPYQVFVPAPKKTGSESEKLPLILFLHGAMERGLDGDLQVKVGLGPVIQENSNSFPAIVVFPQISQKMAWREDSGLPEAMNILKLVMRDYSVDPDRIYLTGISMGGYGVWELAELYPNLFAAIVPIASSREPGPLTNNLHKIPVFASHGARDGICPVSATRAMVEELKKIGNTKVNYQEYEKLKHSDTWEATYRDPSMFEWLFSKTRLR